MATGFMTIKGSGYGLWAALCLFAMAHAAQAASVAVSGIMGDKALIAVDGGPPKVVRAGDRLAGVRVLEVKRASVLLDNAGRRIELGIGQGNIFAGKSAPAADASGGNGTHVITADGRGQFLTTGSVNGRSVSFLVDTGASMVTLPKSVARQAGVDLRNASQTRISTANGVAPAQRVTLNDVRLGGIRANLVEALVVDDQSLPIALLGMSFLNRTDMNRQGDALTLKQRY